MKITIESTEMFTVLGGMHCRIWRGITEGGVACDIAVPLLRVRDIADASEFDRELKAIPPTKGPAVDMRKVW